MYRAGNELARNVAPGQGMRVMVWMIVTIGTKVIDRVRVRVRFAFCRVRVRRILSVSQGLNPVTVLCD